MAEKDLFKLQRYLYKRPQGAGKEQLLARLEKEDKKFNFTPQDWGKFLIPLCAYPDSELFLELMNRANLIDIAEELIVHTCHFQQAPANEIKQVAIIEALLPFISEQDRQTVLDNALFQAAWLGNLAVTTYLIDQGADLRFKKKGSSIVESAQHAAETYGDYRVLTFIQSVI